MNLATRLRHFVECGRDPRVVRDSDQVKKEVGQVFWLMDIHRLLPPNEDEERVFMRMPLIFMGD